MRFFEHKLSLFILFFVIPLLFLPKINIISISGESAGLRIDDLVLFFAGSLLMCAHALSHQRIFKIEGWILLITILSFVSLYLNRLFVHSDLLYLNAKIFFTVRLMEYFIYFYIGAMASYHFNCSSIVKWFFLWNFVIMVLQKLNLAGAVTVEGYNENVSTRVFGVASFPSEMGLVLNLLFCFLIWDDKPSKFMQFNRGYLYALFGVFGIFTIFTGNRISVLALLICFLARLFYTFKVRSIGSLLSLLFFLPLLFIGIAFIITQSEGIYERSASLFSVRNLQLFFVAWDHIDLTKDPFNHMIIASWENYDMSWWIRIHKWLFVIKTFVIHPECYLFGLGPGFCQAALDGGILRIVVEYGLVGSFLFWKFFSCLYRLNRQTKWMIIAFLLNMIFFDAYLAYKTMSFLLFTCGSIFENKLIMAKKERRQNQLENGLLLQNPSVT